MAHKKPNLPKKPAPIVRVRSLGARSGKRFGNKFDSVVSGVGRKLGRKESKHSLPSAQYFFHSITGTFRYAEQSY